MKKNLRFRLLTGQLILVEDVTDYTTDSVGISVTCQEKSVEGKGEEAKVSVYTVKKWFNNAAVVTFTEEFVKV